MSRADEILMTITIALDMLGPAVLLLILRRWTRRWWAAFMGTAVITPFAAFLLTGGVAWFFTYFRVIVHGDTSVPDANGYTVAGYLYTTFAGCGIYGIMFAGMGFGLSLPPMVLWWLVPRRRFNW